MGLVGGEREAAAGFGYRLRDLIEDSGMTQAEIADILGISQPTICRYANGYQFPNVYIACKLARFFDVTEEYLVFGEEESDEHNT